VRPDTVRVGDHTAKGYYRRRFEEAWERYLSPDPQDPPYETKMGTYTTFQNVTGKSGVTFQKCGKPAPNGLCYDVTFQKPENALAREDTTIQGRKCAQCGQDGAELEVMGAAEPLPLHRVCEAAWQAAQDNDLMIPGFLDRRAS